MIESGVGPSQVIDNTDITFIIWGAFNHIVQPKKGVKKMKKLTLFLFAMTLMFLAPDWAKADRFEAIPAAITDTVTGLM